MKGVLLHALLIAANIPGPKMAAVLLIESVDLPRHWLTAYFEGHAKSTLVRR